MAYHSGQPTGPLSGINQDLFVPGVHKEFFYEYSRVTPFYNLIKNRMDAPIYRHHLSDGEGLTFRIGRLSSLDYKSPIIGTDQRRGNEQQQVISYDQVDTVFRTFSVQAEARDIIKLGTKIDIADRMKFQLKEACARNLSWELLVAATTENYPNPLTQKPVFDRIYLAGANVDRAAYNAFAGLKEALNSLNTGKAYNQNGLSLDKMFEQKIMFDQGGRDPDSEAPIRPSMLQTREGWPMDGGFYLADPASLIELRKDPRFSESTIARGAILPNQPEIISGSSVMGKLDGNYIISVPELAKFRQTSADGNVVAAWNLLIGAGAMAVGWYQEPFLVAEFDEFERTTRVGCHEFRGQKALRFPGKLDSTQRVEQGIIHSFVRINQ